MLTQRAEKPTKPHVNAWRACGLPARLGYRKGRFPTQFGVMGVRRAWLGLLPGAPNAGLPRTIWDRWPLLMKEPWLPVGSQTMSHKFKIRIADRRACLVPTIKAGRYKVAHTYPVTARDLARHLTRLAGPEQRVTRLSEAVWSNHLSSRRVCGGGGPALDRHLPVRRIGYALSCLPRGALASALNSADTYATKAHPLRKR